MLDSNMQRLARNRASRLGVSFSEYIAWLVARDLGKPEGTADPSVIFALGNSGGTDIARDKDALAGAAVQRKTGSRSRR